MLFGLLRGSESARPGAETYALQAAAKRALDIARAERLPLAHVAARNGHGRAQHWFANNMLHIVSVMGRRPQEAEWEVLTGTKIEGLTLDGDMHALRIAGAADATFLDLRVSRAEVSKYIAFLRTTR